MIDLLTLRGQIDEIDREIVSLYERRMKISGQVAEYKIETGKKVFDKQREEEKLAVLKSLVSNDFNRHGITELFEQIMSMSRKLQYQMLTEKGALGKLPFIGVDKLDTEKARVVFQGADGAYSQAAMMQYFGDQISSFHVDTFRDAMIAIDEGSADFAVLPIENSTAGVVSEIYDLLAEFENYIVGEQVIKIEHCLMGLPGTKLSDIHTVCSHPQSLMQSARFLLEYPSWKQISMKYKRTGIRARRRSPASMRRSFTGWKYCKRASTSPVPTPRGSLLSRTRRYLKRTRKKSASVLRCPMRAALYTICCPILSTII